MIYHFSNISRSNFYISKTEKLVRDSSEKFDSSLLGFDGCMFGAKLLQAAMGSCLEIHVLQKRNHDRVPIYFHTKSISLNSNQGKI